MKTFQVVLTDRQRMLVEAESYVERGDRYVFLPEDPKAPQFFLVAKVVGIHVFSDDGDESAV